MQKLETYKWWNEVVSLKDELPLLDLASRFGVTPGQIAGALRRTQTSRQPHPPGAGSAKKAWPARPARAESAAPVPQAQPRPEGGTVRPVLNGTGQGAWQVVLRQGPGQPEQVGIVVAPDLVGAAEQAQDAADGGSAFEVVNIRWIGPVL